MQFKVPQFLDIEDKIFGPFTFKQFVYLVGGAGLCYILFKLLGFLIGAIPILIVGSISLALAFYRPNGKPFINMLEAALKYTIQSKLYIWQKYKDAKKETRKDPREIQTEERGSPKLTTNRLKDLAWSLDVLDKKN
ncbi:MAG: PrgI family protein [Candidatus Pacebacteria bacterium]|nr:PrgI family protein [Candidatus Paceibacterota bacterium]MCF7862397.1 PrgI family protein [Candidatus Paceibacterota bacterium]